MKSASNPLSSECPLVLPEVAINDVTAGIDWARDDHAACIVDGRGHKIATTTVEHTTAGLRDLVEGRADGVGGGVWRVAHWATILVLRLSDRASMHPGCRQVTALLA